MVQAHRRFRSRLARRRSRVSKLEVAQVQTAAADDRDGLNSVVYDEAEPRLKDDETLDLGINCCAVCAERETSVVCGVCERIRYCSRRCMARDRTPHAASCGILSGLGDDAGDEAPKAFLDDERGVLVDAWDNETLSRVEHATVPLGDREAASYPLSFAFAFARMDPFAPLRKRETRTVVVIGASDAEAAPGPKIWLGALRATAALSGKFVIALVGPCLTPRPPAYATCDTLSIKLTYHAQNYEIWANRFEPDACVGFNLGLSCPDYDWTQALKALPSARPFAFFTNNRPEQEQEKEILLPFVTTVQSGENPFHSPKWRQSGALANDIYRKHTRVMTGIVS